MKNRQVIKVEMPKEEWEEARNPAYKHFNIDLEYPEHDKAWIGWETTSSYLIYRIKNVLNEEGKTSQTWLYKQLELEWILKTEFNYKTLNT